MKIKKQRNEFTPLEQKVMFENGTEPPFANAYYALEQPGIYVDPTNGQPLFTSLDKFDAGCGWPSFSKPIAPAVTQYKNDYRHGMIRKEVRSQESNIHLGHVFDDGPLETGGLRYCINSAALQFIPLEEMEKAGYGDWLFLFPKK